MQSPKKPPYGVIPEYEEEEDKEEGEAFQQNVTISPLEQKQNQEVELQKGNNMNTISEVMANEFKKDIEELYNKLLDFKKWAAVEYERKKLLRVDYDRFSEMLVETTESVVRIETRAITISQLTENLNSGAPKLQETIVSLNKKMQEISNKPPSFAEVIKLPKKASTAEKIGNVRKIQPKEHVLLLKPTKLELVGENEKQSSEKIRKSLKENIPKKENIRVKKTVNVRGGGLLIVLDTLDDKKKILTNKSLQKGGIKITEPANKKPRIILYDVPSDVNKEELSEIIYEKNFYNSGIQKEDFVKGCVPSFKLGPRDKDTLHWVFECDPEIRKLIINKVKLFIDFTCCKASDYTVAQRCFRCHGFNHVMKHCKKEQDVCGHCSVIGHNSKNCPSEKEIPTCVNCKKNNKPANHKANDAKCPCYRRALQQVIDRTNYGIA